jgi:hypothetical protein
MPADGARNDQCDVHRENEKLESLFSYLGFNFEKICQWCELLSAASISSLGFSRICWQIWQIITLQYVHLKFQSYPHLICRRAWTFMNLLACIPPPRYFAFTQNNDQELTIALWNQLTLLQKRICACPQGVKCKGGVQSTMWCRDLFLHASKHTVKLL